MQMRAVVILFCLILHGQSGLGGRISRPVIIMLASQEIMTNFFVQVMASIIGGGSPSKHDRHSKNLPAITDE